MIGHMAVVREWMHGAGKVVETGDKAHDLVDTNERMSFQPCS